MKKKIIPAKPKVVKVKAWAWVSKKYKGFTLASTNKDSIYGIPCTITIEAKYLRGNK